jgi:hypothetical protein
MIYNLVLSMEKGQHHRRVLWEVIWMKDWCSKNLTRTDTRRISHDRCSKNLTRTRNISPKCNKQVTSKQQTRSSLTSIN